MDKIREFFKNPISYGLVGLIVGIVVGLVVLGWGVWPIQWTDAAPATLQEDYQRDYLCMTIDSFIKNQDVELMQLRWNGLGDGADELLNNLTPAACRFSSAAEIDAFKEVMGLQVLASEFSTNEPAAEMSSELPAESDSIGLLETVEPVDSEAKKISILPLAILILLTLVVGGILVFLMIKRSKNESTGEPKMPKIVIPKKGDAEVPFQQAAKPATKEGPIAQFMTTYRQGDDLYDDSFSIDSVNGEFLGECGVGIAETIGVGDPKKVTALEVWLFDKNDIQTVTKVLMSEHANNDPALRQRLLSKGEPILIEPGMKFLMETASLQLEAHVIDMVYARGPLPENSYFSRLTLEVSVWSK